MTAQLETMAGLSIQSIRALVDEAAGAQILSVVDAPAAMM